MKGTIPKCLEEMVRARYSESTWDQVKKAADLASWHSFLTTEDIPDDTVKALFATTAEVLDKTVQEVMDEFGIHWSTVYAPDIYGVFFNRASSARELLLGMAEVHRVTTATVKNAQPPRFSYRWLDDETLVMTYDSERDMAGLMPGLIRGVGEFYREELQVSREGDHMTIRFMDVASRRSSAPTAS